MSQMVLIIFSLSFLVLIHEFFHLCAAKLSGTVVLEFGIGIPPRLFSFKIGSTTYSVNLIPLGGFVRFKEEGEGSFISRPGWKKALVILAGPVGNFLLAVLILSALFVVGNPQMQDALVIEEVLDGFPASSSGLNPSDLVLEVEGTAVGRAEKVVTLLRQHTGSEITLTVVRSPQAFSGGTMEEVKVFLPPPESSDSPVLGAVLGETFYVSYVSYPWYRAFPEALRESVLVFGSMLVGLGKMLKEVFGGKSALEEVVGVVGLYSIADFAAHLGFRIFANFIFLVSLNLVLFNLLPIPALDGGRLVVVGLESLLKRKFRPKVKQYVNAAGMVLLMVFFILVTVRDVRGLM